MPTKKKAPEKRPSILPMKKTVRFDYGELLIMERALMDLIGGNGSKLAFKDAVYILNEIRKAQTIINKRYIAKYGEDPPLKNQPQVESDQPTVESENNSNHSVEFMCGRIE
jgi:hypothetical protein